MKKVAPNETEIFCFTYPDGTPGRADPLRVRRRLSQATQGKCDDLFDDYLSPSTQEKSSLLGDGSTVTTHVKVPNHDEVVFRRLKAEEDLVKASAWAFEVEYAVGLEQWLLDTVLSFDEWLQKKSGITPTPST